MCPRLVLINSIRYAFTISLSLDSFSVHHHHHHHHHHRHRRRRRRRRRRQKQCHLIIDTIISKLMVIVPPRLILHVFLLYLKRQHRLLHHNGKQLAFHSLTI